MEAHFKREKFSVLIGAARVLGDDFEKSGHHELAATALFDMALNEDCQFVEYGSNLLFGKVSIFGDLGE